MNSKQLIELGVPKRALDEAGALIVALRESGADMARLPEEMAAIVAQPEAFLGDSLRAALARELYEPAFKMRETPAPWHQWGEGLDAAAVVLAQLALPLPAGGVAGAELPFTLDVPVPDGQPTIGVRVHVDTTASGDVTEGDLLSTRAYPVLTNGAPDRLIVDVASV